MNEQTLKNLENAVAGLLNDTLIISQSVDNRHSLLLPAMLGHVSKLTPYTPMPQYGGFNNNNPQFGHPQQQHFNQQPQNVNHYTWETLQEANRRAEQARQQRPPHMDNADTSVPIDMVKLLTRLQSNVDSVKAIIDAELGCIPVGNYQSTLDKLTERVDAIEKGGVMPTDAGDPAPKKPDYSTRESFPIFCNLHYPRAIQALKDELGAFNTPHFDMHKLLWSIAVNIRDDISRVLATSKILFDRHLSKRSMFCIPETNQSVYIHPVTDGAVLVLYDILTLTVICVLEVKLADGGYVLSCVKQPRPLLDSIFNETVAPAETEPRPLYENVMNLEGFRERIVEMRKGITILTVPKKALMPTIKQIGTISDTVNPDVLVAPVFLDAEQHELLTVGNAVYSLPNNRIRVVVATKNGITLLMAYDSQTYVIHNIYTVTQIEDTDKYQVSCSQSPHTDLLFILSLGNI